MGLLDGLRGLLGKKDEAPARVAKPKGRPEEKKKLSRQVYASSFTTIPDWAVDLDQAHIIEACEQHVVCKFTPHIEVKKIMSTRSGVDGNLETEYEGVAADCGAIKTFGKQAALRDGYMQPYRYVSLNHIYACCCDKPRKCTFFSLAAGLDQDLAKRQRRVGG